MIWVGLQITQDLADKILQAAGLKPELQEGEEEA